MYSVLMWPEYVYWEILHECSTGTGILDKEWFSKIFTQVFKFYMSYGFMSLEFIKQS